MKEREGASDKYCELGDGGNIAFSFTIHFLHSVTSAAHIRSLPEVQSSGLNA